ncbi:hypothetical protein Hdeb2414_s0011g00364591 [Helianthus debilis subsp. tardiflorus]
MPSQLSRFLVTVKVSQLVKASQQKSTVNTDQHKSNMVNSDPVKFNDAKLT